VTTFAQILVLLLVLESEVLLLVLCTQVLVLGEKSLLTSLPLVLQLQCPYILHKAEYLTAAIALLFLSENLYDF